MLDNTPTRMEFDIFGNTSKLCEYYSDDFNFYKLYEKKFIIRTIVGKLSSIFSNAKFEDLSGKDSKLLLKLQTPNQEQSSEEFLKDFGINLWTSGYSMIWKKYTGSFGDFDKLELIIISTDSDITEVGKKSVNTTINGKSEIIKKEDIIFFYDSQRSKDSLAGVSRLKPCKVLVDNVIDAQFGVSIQMEKSGVTVVSPKSSSTANNIDEGLNAPVPTMTGGLKTQKEEIEERLNARGIKNRIIVSNKGLDANNLSADLNNFKFSEVVESSALAIYDVYSFAPELTPYGKNATFENKPAAENKLIEAEIIPLAESLIRSLNQDFKAYGQVNMSYDHINSVAETKNKVVAVKKTVAETYSTLYKDGLITMDEAKKQLILNGVIS